MDDLRKRAEEVTKVLNEYQGVMLIRSHLRVGEVAMVRRAIIEIVNVTEALLIALDAQYENAHPDEPMFVLLGRDQWAAELVRLWADMRELYSGENPAKVAEARKCADAMEAWCRGVGKTPRRFDRFVKALPI